MYAILSARTQDDIDDQIDCALSTQEKMHAIIRAYTEDDIGNEIDCALCTQLKKTCFERRTTIKYYNVAKLFYVIIV